MTAPEQPTADAARENREPIPLRPRTSTVCPRCGRAGRQVILFTPVNGEWTGRGVCATCINALGGPPVLHPTEPDAQHP